jgi:ABC-2 type transport system permease protein
MTMIRTHWLEARYGFLALARTPAFTVPTLLFPLMFYVFFGVIFGARGPSLAMPTYLLATYGVFGIIGPALFGFGVGVANERDAGTLTLKRATPMPVSAYFFAKIAMSLVFGAAIISGLFALSAYAAGVTLHRVQWFQMAGILLAGTLPFCALGLAVGSWARGQAAVAIVNLIYLPMAFLSGLWMPISVFPEALRTLALAFPPYHLSQLALKVIDMDQGQSAILHVSALVAFSLAFLVIAAAGFRRVAAL